MKLTQKESGIISAEMKSEEFMMAQSSIEDGLSFIGYADAKSDMGMLDPSEDLAYGIGLLEDAIAMLKEINL